MAAYGDVDELNAWLGLARASVATLPEAAEIESMLVHIQRDLFALGSRLADPGHKIAGRVTKATIGASDIARLEGWIDQLEAHLPALTSPSTKRRLRKSRLPGPPLQDTYMSKRRIHPLCRRQPYLHHAQPQTQTQMLLGYS